MILIINTIERDKIELGLFQGKTVNFFEFNTTNHSDDILPAIKGTLSNHKIELRQITGILVHEGPGSFTGIRIGLTVANTLAWALDLPVDKYQDDNLEEALVKISRKHHFKALAMIKNYDTIN